MNRLSKLLCATALIAVGGYSSANATVNSSFSVTNQLITVTGGGLLTGTRVNIGVGTIASFSSGVALGRGAVVVFPNTVVGDVVYYLGGTINAASGYVPIYQTLAAAQSGGMSFSWTSSSGPYNGDTFNFVSAGMGDVYAYSLSASFYNIAFIGTLTDTSNDLGLGQTADLTFTVTSTGQGNYSAATSFDTPNQLVPEPVSMALLGMGAVGLAAVRRRRAV